MSKPSLNSLLNFQPKAIDPSAQSVEESAIEGLYAPVVLKPTSPILNLKAWMASNKPQVRSYLDRYGAILFRGFDVPTREHFREIIGAYEDEFIAYTDRSSPRTEVKNKVYTSTEHPADQVINMHNELSYSNRWPLIIAFYCNVEPGTGGETPICDVRKVLGALPADVVDKFRSQGIKYRRFLQPGIGLAWQEVFQTDDRSVVEQVCADKGQQFQWLDNDSLVIEWVRPAVAKHPVTGEEVWFNHGYFFNYLALEDEIRLAFENEHELPFNTYYGDGERIPEDVVGMIRDAYAAHRLTFPWRRGDILMLDNMVTAHGRESFTGTREINVAMTQAMA